VVGRILWPVLIALALVVAVVVSAAGEETRAELEYMDQIRSQTEALARSGSAIRDIMPRVREIDRDEFTTVFESVATDVDVASAFVETEPPTESLIPVWALYRQAVDAWSEGVANLAQGIILAADDPESPDAMLMVADGLASLRTGDRLYDDLQSEFDRQEVPEPVAPLLDVSLSTGEGGLLSLAQTYVAAAQSSTNNLGLRPGLAISQVISNPLWQMNVESQPVIPFTEEVVFSVVVSNIGNAESDPQSVNLTLTGGEEPVTASLEVPTLRPSGQVTLEFAPLPVEPEIPYEVFVQLTVSGVDADTTDNERLVPFTVNAA
jgi:hypothetical protein